MSPLNRRRSNFGRVFWTAYLLNSWTVLCVTGILNLQIMKFHWYKAAVLTTVLLPLFCRLGPAPTWVPASGEWTVLVMDCQAHITGLLWKPCRADSAFQVRTRSSVMRLSFTELSVSSVCMDPSSKCYAVSCTPFSPDWRHQVVPFIHLSIW